ncbi:MAG: acyl-CoA dehydrogenase [Zhongshania sp.]|jgi:acyl-CoA dehydrogenase
MRAISMAERALEMLCKRVESRVAFGKALFRLGANDDIIADARMNIDMVRY